MKIHNEKGIALPLVMIALMLGAIIIPVFLNRVSTGLLASRNYGDMLDVQYACDAGAEHAIWNLIDGGADGLLDDAGDIISYSLDEAVNDETVNVKVSSAWEVIAWDNFNSGGWTGGGGWLGNWQYSGAAAVTSSYTPYEGTHHVRMTSGTGVITRAVDLSKQFKVHLTFWARAESFEPGNTAICRISPDGSNWTTINTWDSNSDDNRYHFFDFDITPFGMTGTFYISFMSLMDATNDYFYIDDIKVVWPAADIELMAYDDFESGGWAGGEGWLGDWTHSGNSSIAATGIPFGGSYHLLIQGPAASVTRAVDLSGQSVAHLQFWAKVDAFEGNDYAYCRVSTDNSTWNTIYTFSNSTPNNTYVYYDIDITNYGLTDNVRFSFVDGMNMETDYLYIDDISINAIRAYCITVTVGDRILKAAVDLMGGQVTVLSWQYIT